MILRRYFITTLFLFLSVSTVPADNKYSGEHKDRVKKQHASDIDKRDDILKKFGAFIAESNAAISGEGVELSFPVEPGSVTEISDTGEMHAGGVIVPKIYGHVNSSTLNMRSEDSASSAITGRLKFRERVEIIYQSDKSETINKMHAPWLLVCRDNGDEGWVFGAYVSDYIPPEPDKESGRTEWNMIIPASGKLTSRFGKRVDPVTRRRQTFHKGIDIAAPAGTPVYAAGDGIVSTAGFVKNGYGNLIIIRHADDIASYYGHLSAISVRSGRVINKGDLIGRVGSTGRSTGPHLHFEVRRGDRALDPESFIR